MRYLAAEALGNLGDLRSIAYLDLLRSDKDPDLRFVSGQSLSKITYVREILQIREKWDAIPVLSGISRRK